MMHRRGFLKSAVAQTVRDRPNFLFLIADDLTFRAVHALGNGEVHTPAIDSLVEHGCTFTHCFHQGSWSAAVCVPSRTMLNSGLTTFRARTEIENSPLWGQTFGDAGYDTFITGKWHLSDATLKRSFQQLGPVSPGMFESGPDAYHRPSPGNAWTAWDTSRKGQWLHSNEWHAPHSTPDHDEIRHSAAIWADSACDQIRTAAQGGKPFFLYTGFNSPHDPRQAPREFIERYPQDRIQIPPNYAPDHPFDQGDHRVRDELLAPFPRTVEAVRLHRAEYYAHITYMDAQIGRILGTLSQLGLASNTYVIFTSDHGLAVGEHGLMGKQNLYDHSVRMPYVIVGPGIPKGKRVDTLMYQHSTFATTCELAGIPVPKSVEFPSVAKLIKGSAAAKHDAVFCWYLNYQRSVRTEEYKLIAYPKAGVTQLFNVVKDPWETANLSAERAFAATKQHLLERLRRFQRELGDTFCEPV
jgi:arylsulfatase A-like enzyme